MPTSRAVATARALRSAHADWRARSVRFQLRAALCPRCLSAPQVGEWSLDKRHYMGTTPPPQLKAPPACAHDRAHVLRALYNNATEALRFGTPVRHGQPDGFRHIERFGSPWESVAASRVMGTGPWMLAGTKGASGPFRLEKVWFLTGGWAYSSKGHGRWGADGPDGISLSICTSRFKIRVAFGEEWTMVANGETMGWLQAERDDLARWARSGSTQKPQARPPYSA